MKYIHEIEAWPKMYFNKKSISEINHKLLEKKLKM